MTGLSLRQLPLAKAVLSSRETTQAGAIDEAHETIANLFCDHDLTPLGKSEVKMRLRSAHAAGVGIELLDYGSSVQIAVDEGLGDFYLIQIPLRGKATLEAGNAFVDSNSRIATVPPLDRGFTMRWGAGTPTLIIYVERKRLVDVAQKVYGAEADKLDLGLHMQLDAREGEDFIRSVLEFHDILEQRTTDGFYALKLSAELLLARLLNAVDNSVSRSLNVWDAPESPRTVPGEALVRRYKEAAESAVLQGKGVVEIASDLGIPLRTLQGHVRAVTGSTPSAILRDVQMRWARELLLVADPLRETVTNIASRAGFTHMGRFAADYRKQFGESPTETLRR